jgi:hypothetical protein
MSLSMPIQWHHSHADPIWPEGIFKAVSGEILMCCVCSVHAAGERHADGEHGAREDRRRHPRLPLRSHREDHLALLLKRKYLVFGSFLVEYSIKQRLQQ